MIYILSGTNRPDSNTRKVADIVHSHYSQIGVQSEVLDLCDLPLDQARGEHYGQTLPPVLGDWVNKLSASDGIHVVTPEYNGSMPGVLKYFIDFWRYPETFEYRPVAFIGLGGRFGGLRPVEHLQQIFGYRNSFQYPERVFLMNIWNVLKDQKIVDPLMGGLIQNQVENFVAFIEALKSAKLHTLVRPKN